MSVLNRRIFTSIRDYFRGESVTLASNVYTIGNKEYINTNGMASLTLGVNGPTATSATFRLLGYTKDEEQVINLHIFSGRGEFIGSSATGKGTYRIDCAGFEKVRLSVDEVVNVSDGSGLLFNGTFHSTAVNAYFTDNSSVFNEQLVTAEDEITSRIITSTKNWIQLYLKRAATVGAPMIIDIIYLDGSGGVLEEDNGVAELNSGSDTFFINLKSFRYKIRLRNTHHSNRTVWCIISDSASSDYIRNQSKPWITPVHDSGAKPLPWRYEMDMVDSTSVMLAMKGVDDIPLSLKFGFIDGEDEYDWIDGEGLRVKTILTSGFKTLVAGPYQTFPRFTKGVIKIGGMIWRRNDSRIRALTVDNDQNVIYSNETNEIKKLDKDGNLLWERNVGDRPTDIKTDSFGNVYTCFGSSIRKYSPSGLELWTNVHSTDVRIINVSDNGNIIYAGFNGGILKRLNDTGDEVWALEVESGNDMDVVGSFIYLTGALGGVYKVEDTGSEGVVVWSLSLGGVSFGIKINSEGTVYVNNDDDLIRKIEQPNDEPTVVDTFNTGSTPIPLLIDSNDDLYVAGVGSANRRLRKLDKDFGLIWRFEQGSTTSDVLAIDSDFNIIKGNRDGQIYKIANIGKDLEIRIQEVV